MKVMIFTTGGSIDKTYSTQFSDFVVGEPYIGELLKEANVNLEYEIEPLFRKDSLNITDEDRQMIAAKVRESSQDQIIITHGTDTMVQTAHALRGIENKVIVITGAMQPAAFKQTDAAVNIGLALGAVQILPPGVYITMSGRIFEADKTRKNLQTNQYESL